MEYKRIRKIFYLIGLKPDKTASLYPITFKNKRFTKLLKQVIFDHTTYCIFRFIIKQYIDSSEKTAQNVNLKHVSRRPDMKRNSILLNPAGSVVLALFSIMLFLTAGSPAQNACGNIFPVIKEIRPYKNNIPCLSAFNDDLNLQVKKKESLFYPIIEKASHKHDVDPALIKAIIMAESRYNPTATSKKGAIGLMQIMPHTASAFSAEDMYDPVHNINVGVEYLKRLLNQFEGNLELALAAYNAGPGKVKKYKGVPPYAATIFYINKVFEYYRYYLNA